MKRSDRNVEALIHHYAPMVKRMAMHLASRIPMSVPLEDLVQCGLIGLLEAIDRYEVQDDAQFETYAVARIRGAMLDLLRDHDWVPRSVRQAMREVEEMIDRLSHHLGRPPTDREVAEALGWPVEEYYRVLDSAQGHAILYYEDLTVEDEGERADFLERFVGDTQNDPETLTERQELKKRVAEAISRLPEREQQVLALYYEHELNLKEIGAVLDLSESRVSQILTSAIARIRAQLLGEEGKPSTRRRGRPRKPSSVASSNFHFDKDCFPSERTTDGE
ncbi:MAG: RNA polymerase sigma factor FliA [Hydrogenophilus sp.]|nr:RNA polymerase sigma factor FliA [Hydrogenophilus sp.]